MEAISAKPFIDLNLHFYRNYGLIIDYLIIFTHLTYVFIRSF
jgi:hypothetical protein